MERLHSLEDMEITDKVIYEKVPDMATAYIAIHNGEKNIMSMEVLRGLEKYIDALKDDLETKYAVFHSGRITENGKEEPNNARISSESAECSGYFSTGANIREMSEFSEEQALEYSKYGQSLMKKIEDLKQTTIAIIPKGFCVGGGLELSMSCKYRIANEGSLFQMPEKKLSIIPGWRGTQTLPYHIGSKEAEDFLNNKKTIKARKAYEIGLIDYLFENPLGQANSMIKNNVEFASRSLRSPEKMVIDGRKIENDDDEAILFAESWKEGIPQGIVSFLKAQKKDVK